MAVAFYIPSYLRTFTGGHARVSLATSPATVQAALDELWARYPGVRDRVVTEQGELRPHVNVFVGEDNIRDRSGFKTAVDEGAEISIIPAVSGGCSPTRSPAIPRPAAGGRRGRQARDRR